MPSHEELVRIVEKLTERVAALEAARKDPTRISPQPVAPSTWPWEIPYAPPQKIWYTDHVPISTCTCPANSICGNVSCPRALRTTVFDFNAGTVTQDGQEL